MMDPTPIRPRPSTPTLRKLALLACLGAALLAGCSSGDDTDEPAAAAATDGDVPLTALASTTAYAQYVGAQTSDDRREPMRLGPLPAPVSDTDAPIAVP